ncbi:hypothetical protein PMAYCL1PPCAC_07501, partial [Pristionchus mayeri]
KMAPQLRKKKSSGREERGGAKKAKAMQPGKDSMKRDSEHESEEIQIVFDVAEAANNGMPNVEEETEADVRVQLAEALQRKIQLKKELALSNGLVDEMGRTRKELCEAKEELTTSKEQLKDTRDKMDEMKALLTQTKDKLEETENELTNKTKQLEKANLEVRSAQRRAEYGESGLALMELKPSISGIHNANLHERVAEANTEIYSLKTRLSELLAKNEELNVIGVRLKRENEDWKKLKKDIELRGRSSVKSEELQSEVSRLRKERNEWRDKAEHESRKNKRLSDGDSNQLKKEKETWQLDWADEKKKNERLESKLKDLEKELDKFRIMYMKNERPSSLYGFKSDLSNYDERKKKSGEASVKPRERSSTCSGARKDEAGDIIRVHPIH